jgi:hypothetical protein
MQGLPRTETIGDIVGKINELSEISMPLDGVGCHSYPSFQATSSECGRFDL